MAKQSKKSGEVLGEGNYSAARNFRASQEKFVKQNKARIPQLGKDAEAALEGREGPALKAAAKKAKAHSRAKGK